MRWPGFGITQQPDRIAELQHVEVDSIAAFIGVG